MAITHVGSTSAASTTSGGGTIIQVNKPANTQANDILVIAAAVIHGTDNFPNILVPTGFTAITATQNWHSNGTYRSFMRRLDGTETGPFVIDWGQTLKVVVVTCTAYRGFPTNRWLHIGGAATGSGLTVSAPNQFPLEADEFLICHFVHQDGGGNKTSVASGMTERIDAGATNNTFLCGISAQDQQLTSTASTGTKSATMGVSNGWLGYSILAYSDTTPPAVPVWASAGEIVPGNNRVYLDWEANSETDFKQYNVLRATASGGPYTKINADWYSTTAYTDTTAVNGTQYWYKLSATDAAENTSAQSAFRTTTPVATPPANPTGLATGAFTKNMVVLNWTANTEPDLSHYDVYQSTTSGSGYTKINTSDVAQNSYSVSGLATGTRYYWVVRAVDTEGAASGNSNEVTEQPRFTPPAVPTGFAREEFNTYIDLEWTANVEGDLAGYNLYRTTTTGTGYTKLNTGALITGTTYRDNGLTNGTTYYYVLTSVDTEGGESAYSNEVFGTPRPPERLIPNGFVSTNLTGPVTNVQDDPDAPDSNWLTITDPSGAVNTPTNYPTNNALVAGGFTNPTNVYGDDNTYATVTPARNTDNTHDFWGFGFDAIPVGSTITEVRIQAGWFQATANINSVGLNAWVGGVAQGAEASWANLGTTERMDEKVYTTLTRDNLLDANFKVRVRAGRGGGNTSAQVSIDYVRVQVTYQAPGSTVNTEGWFTMTGLSSGRQLRVGPNYQAVKVQVRKKGNQLNPSVRVEIRQGGGGVVTTVIPDTIVTSTTILSGTWNAQALLGISGEDVEIRVYGTGAAGGAVEIGAVEWDATWVVAPPPSGREHYDWVGATGW